METESVPLPPPEVIWARIALWEALMSASGMPADDPVITGTRIRFDDGGGNWATLARYEGSRAVLFGWDRSADTAFGSEIFDPLACAPSWVPIAELDPAVVAAHITFVVWWESGVWHRTASPWDDGMWACLPDLITSEPRAYNADLQAFYCEESEQSGICGVTEADHTDSVSALCRAADTRTLRSDSLELLCAVDPATHEEIFELLRRAGVTEGSELPEEPSPEPFTGRRMRRTMTEFAHKDALGAAMRAATEFRREPPYPTVELVRILDVIDVNAYGPVDAAFYVGQRSIHVGSHAILGPFEFNFRNSTLLRDLWIAEGTEQGRWLFIRFRTTDEGIVVDRAYDHWPQWFVTDSIGGINRHCIVTELGSRPAHRQPGWAAVAADDYAYTYD